MQRAGIGGALIMEVDGTPQGRIAFGTEAWRGMFRFAWQEAGRLGLEINMNDGSGWTGSGGPWNTPEMSLEFVRVGPIRGRMPNLTNMNRKSFLGSAAGTPAGLADMRAVDVKGPSRYRETAPPGRLISAVAMNTKTLQRVNLTPRVQSGSLAWQVPAGDWGIMFFTCVVDGNRGLVDYLEPESVKKYVSLTYEKYYGALSAHFGKTLDED